ncbi:MAG: lamin tail domain-containing protein [Deltaproteobacteria bacterium]|nr:lamin tail domain-containing protein [Deltaproteobacteria bacterium]
MRLALVVAAMLSITLAACGPSGGGEGCKDKIISGDLVITEVFADFAPPAGGTGADEGKEWFEVYNASDRPIELEGLTLVHSRPDGMKTNSHEMTAVTIAPGQFLTLGNSADDLLPPYVDYGYAADLDGLFNTDGGKLALKCGDTEIDAAIYDGVHSGHSRQLTSGAPPDYTLNDDQANWCEAKDTEFESGNFGTPGQDNDCAPVIVGQCNDGGTMRAAVAPGLGDLVITEVMPKPKAVSATVGQWFEILATKDVDLNGVGLDRANDTAGPAMLSSPDCIHLTAGTYAVFARSGDSAMNGGLTTLGTFSFSINPTTVTPDLQVVYGGAVIDSVTWTTSTTGKSLSLDPDFTNATANDDVANFCDGSVVYNTVGADTDLGTPGAANTQCGIGPQPNQCLDNGVSRTIVKPAAGQLVITEFLSNAAGTGTDGAQEWFEITNSGATSFDLNDLSLKGTTTSNLIQSADCKPVAPLGFALFAHGTDPLQNGMLPAVDATFTFAISTQLQVLDGTTVLDAMTFGTSPDGVAKQLKPTNTNVTDNDTAANFCNATAAQMYGTAANFGTPKALNVCL